jgi:hypothetical protein
MGCSPIWMVQTIVHFLVGAFVLPALSKHHGINPCARPYVPCSHCSSVHEECHAGSSCND